MATSLPAELVEFLQELEQNNNREWFHAHKKRYETFVKKPFEHFVDALIEKVRQVEPRTILTAKDAIFRIHRDTRFSSDKSPYKNHVSAVISPGGRKDPNGPGFYLEISGHQMRLYAGAYMPDKGTLYQIRERIASETERFRRLYTDPAFVRFFGEIHGEKNKVLPAEFKEAAQGEPLIYNKTFYYFTDWPASDAARPDLADDILLRYKAARPLTLFLTDFS